MNSIFHRRSIRQFTPEVPDNGQIEQILKAAMAAPTACDDRQYQFYVVLDPEIRQALAQTSPYDRCAAAAPAVIVPCFEDGAGYAPEYIPVNMGIVCENLMLEADDLGLGTVFLGIYPEQDRMEAVRKVLQLPEGLTPFALIPVGHPAAVPADKDKFDPDRIHWIGRQK